MLIRILPVALFLLAAVASAQTAQLSSDNTVTALGTAEIMVDPDVANLTLTVTSKGKTVADAQHDNAQKSKDLLNGLKAQFNLKAGQYKNSISESKDVEYVNNKTVVKGEIVRNNITIKVLALDKLGAMVDAIANAGGELGYISYGLINSQAVKEQALQEAALNAKANAQALIKGYNRSVGNVVAVVQGGANAAVFHAQAAAMRSGTLAGAPAPAPTEVTSGQITVTANVTVMFLLK